MPEYRHLTEKEILDLIDGFSPEAVIPVIRIRYRNKQELRSTTPMTRHELSALILAGIEEEHLFGGDLELELPWLGQTLVGHHDGIFWLTPSA